MEEHHELRPKEADLPDGASQDEGRDEGDAVVFEPRPGEESAAVRNLPRLGNARERFDVPNLGYWGDTLQWILEAVDAIAENVGLPLEKKTEKRNKNPGIEID